MKLALRIAFSVAVLALLLVYAVDAREVGQMLAAFHPGYLLLALAVVTVDRVLMTYKWLLLLAARGQHVPLLPGVTMYCSSQVWGLALPATVGADAIRAVMVAKRGVDAAEAAASIVVERIVGFLLALALGIVSLFVLRSLGILDERYSVVLYAGIALLAAAIALVAGSLHPRFLESLGAVLPSRLRASTLWTQWLRFAGAYRSLGADRRTLVRFAGLTIVEQLLSVTLPWVLALGLGVPANLLLLLGVLPVSNLIARLPVSFDGIGVFEALFVGLLVLGGISAEAALAIALASRIVQLAAFLPWWLAQVAGTGAVRPPQAPQAAPHV